MKKAVERDDEMEPVLYNDNVVGTCFRRPLS